MPISLRDLQKRGVDLEIEFYGETGIATYDPTTINRQYIDAWQEENRKLAEERGEDASDEQRRLDNARQLCKLIKDWDTIGLDGKKMPLDPERIATELPEQFVQEISTAVVFDVLSLGKLKSMTAVRELLQGLRATPTASS